MKKINKTMIITSLICLIPVIIGLVLYPQLPEQIATHWGFDGEPNGYSSRFVGAFVLPLILLAVNCLLPMLLKLDPKYSNMSEKLVQVVYWVIPIVSLICSAQTLSAALGVNLHINVVLPVFLGLLFVIIGNYMPKTKQSYTMGIKLPWTLNSEENWNATHRVGGFCWVAGGLLMIAGSFFSFRYIIFIVTVAVAVLVPSVYSYLFYLKEKNREE